MNLHYHYAPHRTLVFEFIPYMLSLSPAVSTVRILVQSPDVRAGDQSVDAALLSISLFLSAFDSENNMAPKHKVLLARYMGPECQKILEDDPTIDVPYHFLSMYLYDLPDNSDAVTNNSP